MYAADEAVFHESDDDLHMSLVEEHTCITRTWPTRYQCPARRARTLSACPLWRRNAYTHPDTLIANAQDRLCIATHEQLQVPPLRLLQKIFLHRVLILIRQIQPLASPEQVRVVRDRLRLRRCVDNGDELFEVPPEERIVEDPVLVLEAMQERVAPNGCVAGLELIVRALALLFERVDAIRQSAGQPERLALVRRERSACRAR